jgi:L-alanine-DL-glutamate epimerase-like enolase superfamily enzyme
VHAVSTKQVRAGVEMAILDALAQSVGMPLWWLFGGQGNTIVTDITVIMLIEPALMLTPFAVDCFRKFDGRD